MPTNRQLFLQHLAQTTQFPLAIEIQRAEGVYMYGPNGRRYLDLISGIGVSNVGHCHPEVVEAVQRQAATYMHLMVYGELVQSPQVKLAERLTGLLPSTLDNVYLVNSGSEAVEGAMKVAKRYTGRTEIVSAFNAYHGSTHGALSIGGGEQFKNAFRPLLPDVRQITYNHLPDLEQVTERTAAVIIETIQGEAGVRTPSEEYMKALRKKCTATGALLVLDEIQTGFGRTGKLWAFEHFGIVPDVLVLAKGMGGGMPIGAFITSYEIMQQLTHDPLLGHITTFGGHPVSCAASLATLQIIEGQQLYTQAEQKAQRFIEKLKHPAIRGIRNKGLMMAVEFGSFEQLKPIIDRALELGVLTDWFLYCDSAMRIAPPLTITYQQIDEACALILQAIEG